MSYPQLKEQLVHNSSGRRLWKMSHKKQRQQETLKFSELIPGRHLSTPNLDAEGLQAAHHPHKACRRTSPADSRSGPDAVDMVTDVSTVQGSAVNSNHYLVRLKIMLRAQATKCNSPPLRRTRWPMEEQGDAFNKQVTQALGTTSSTSCAASSTDNRQATPPRRRRTKFSLKHRTADSPSQRQLDASLRSLQQAVLTATQSSAFHWRLSSQNNPGSHATREDRATAREKGDMRRPAYTRRCESQPSATRQRLKDRLVESEQIRTDHKPRPYPSWAGMASRPAAFSQPMAPLCPTLAR